VESERRREWRSYFGRRKRKEPTPRTSLSETGTRKPIICIRSLFFSKDKLHEPSTPKRERKDQELGKTLRSGSSRPFHSFRLPASSVVEANQVESQLCYLRSQRRCSQFACIRTCASGRLHPNPGKAETRGVHAGASGLVCLILVCVQRLCAAGQPQASALRPLHNVGTPFH